MKINYPLNLTDFEKKSNDTIKLFEKMCETFGSKNKIELNQFQRGHLKTSIMAACLDSHYNGFSNSKEQLSK